jgi:hypothetical protein
LPGDTADFERVVVVADGAVDEHGIVACDSSATVRVLAEPGLQGAATAGVGGVHGDVLQWSVRPFVLSEQWRTPIFYLVVKRASRLPLRHRFRKPEVPGHLAAEQPASRFIWEHIWEPNTAKPARIGAMWCNGSDT